MVRSGHTLPSRATSHGSKWQRDSDRMCGRCHLESFVQEVCDYIQAFATTDEAIPSPVLRRNCGGEMDVTNVSCRPPRAKSPEDYYCMHVHLPPRGSRTQSDDQSGRPRDVTPGSSRRADALMNSPTGSSRPGSTVRDQERRGSRSCRKSPCIAHNGLPFARQEGQLWELTAGSERMLLSCGLEDDHATQRDIHRETIATEPNQYGPGLCIPADLPTQ